jgi:hypothetical protein
MHGQAINSKSRRGRRVSVICRSERKSVEKKTETEAVVGKDEI